MARFIIAAVVLLVTSFVSGQQIGWRNDGTGVYPAATPPLTWSRVSTSIAALRTQAEPPKGNEPAGQPMEDGVIRQWLILGPLAATKGEKDALIDPVFAADESQLAVAPGAEAHGAKWTLFKTDTAYIDCAQLFSTAGQKQSQQVVYAHAFLYAPADTPVIVRVMHSSLAHLWVNGKLAHKPEQADLAYNHPAVTLTKGWNRLLLRITPMLRTDQPTIGSWYANVVIQAKLDSSPIEQKNIAWRTPLPSACSFGPPIAVKGRIFLESEPADLVCLDAATGKILWVRSNNYNELATDEERKANADTFKEMDQQAERLKAINDSFAVGNPPKLEYEQGGVGYKEKLSLEKSLYAAMKKIDADRYTLPKGQDVGNAGTCPVSDGQRVYAWFATGVTCCYDLDGKLIWRRLDNEGSFFEHGHSVSPILADGKLLVVMNKLIALDAATGQRLWTTEFNQQPAKRFHGTPVATRIGDTAVCISPTGHIVRLSDGKILREKGPEIATLQQEIPSPVVLGNTFYRLSTYGQFYQMALPAQIADPLKLDPPRIVKVDSNKFPVYYNTWHMSSPLVHDGLAYCLNNLGVLTVVDTTNMAVVYQKLLDIDHFQAHLETAGRGIGASPALAGSGKDARIYLLGTTGTTLVIKPGRTYEQLAKNHIESLIARNWSTRHERFVASPVLDGDRLYLRGERYLYCISDDPPK